MLAVIEQAALSRLVECTGEQLLLLCIVFSACLIHRLCLQPLVLLEVLWELCLLLQGVLQKQ